jgi:hypothetical protein
MSSVGSNITIGVSANISDLKAKMAGAKKEVQGLDQAVKRVGGGHGGGGIGAAMKYLKPTFKELGIGGEAGILGHALKGLGAGGMLGALAPVAAGVGMAHLLGQGLSEAGRQSREDISASHKLGVTYQDYQQIKVAAGDNKEALQGLATQLRMLSERGAEAAASMARFRQFLPAPKAGSLATAQGEAQMGGVYDKYSSPRVLAQKVFGIGTEIGLRMMSKTQRMAVGALAAARDAKERAEDEAHELMAETANFTTPGEALKSRLLKIANAHRFGMSDVDSARAAVLAGGQYQSALGQSASMPGAMTEGSAAAYSAVAGYQLRGQDAQNGQEKMLELLGSIDKSLVSLAQGERNFQHQPAIP